MPLSTCRWCYLVTIIIIFIWVFKVWSFILTKCSKASGPEYKTCLNIKHTITVLFHLVLLLSHYVWKVSSFLSFLYFYLKIGLYMNVLVVCGVWGRGDEIWWLSVNNTTYALARNIDRALWHQTHASLHTTVLRMCKHRIIGSYYHEGQL